MSDKIIFWCIFLCNTQCSVKNIDNYPICWQIFGLLKVQHIRRCKLYKGTPIRFGCAEKTVDYRYKITHANDVYKVTHRHTHWKVRGFIEILLLSFSQKFVMVSLSCWIIKDLSLNIFLEFQNGLLNTLINSFSRDQDPRVRSKAVLSLAQVLRKVDCENVSRKECELFSDFLLRDLSPLAHDSHFFVKRAFARVIGDIGEIAYRFARRCIEGKGKILYNSPCSNMLIFKNKIKILGMSGSDS